MKESVEKGFDLNAVSKKISILILILLPLFSSFSRAEDGVTENEIFLGMSNAQTGPLSEVGLLIKEGATVYFDKVNAAGGIQGRKIKLLIYDDGYEPNKAIENTRRFIDREKVFALFGYVGSPISAAIVPTITRAQVPYLFPFTGAGFLRSPANKYIFTLRASYAEETETMVARLTQDLKITKIGLFSQDDALGEAGRTGVIRALRKRNMSLVGDGKYQRNTVDVDAALETLMKANPEAVIMFCPYTPCAAFLKKAKERGFSPRFLLFSGGAAPLAHEAGKASDGVLMTQVVPNPSDSSLPIVKEYLSDMKAVGLIPDLTSLESYIGAKVLVEALKKTVPLTREGLISTLEEFRMDGEGLEVWFSPTQHQGLHQVFLTKIENGKVVTIQNLK